MHNARTRILVVDDAVVVRIKLRSMLGTDSELDVIGAVKNGRLALDSVAADQPDVVLLDVELPDMSGVEVLEQIRDRFPGVAVILLGGDTEQTDSATLRALAMDAVDVVAKPATLEGEAATRFMRELTHTIKQISGGRPRSITTGESRRSERAPSITSRLTPCAPSAPIDIVVIGSSTGGPNALVDLVPHFGADFPVPIVIVQHMPPVFTAQLAKRLDGLSGVTFAEGDDGVVLEAGAGWIAPGGKHMVLGGSTAQPELVTNTDDKENSCRPAVDPLLRSVARAYGARCLAVILTGMGSDGMLGCQEIKRAGGRVIAQDEGSSVVWGMPGFVVRDGSADTVLPLNEIGPTITRWVQMSRLGRDKTRQARDQRRTQ